MAKVSAIAICVSMFVPVVFLLCVPVLRKDILGLVMLVGIVVVPYAALLLVHWRSRTFSPGLVVVGLVTVGMAVLHTYAMFAVTEVHTDADGAAYLYTDAQGGLALLLIPIFQLVGIVAPVGLALELVHMVRRRRRRDDRV